MTRTEKLEIAGFATLMIAVIPMLMLATHLAFQAT